MPDDRPRVRDVGHRDRRAGERAARPAAPDAAVPAGRCATIQPRRSAVAAAGARERAWRVAVRDELGGRGSGGREPATGRAASGEQGRSPGASGAAASPPRRTSSSRNLRPFGDEGAAGPAATLALPMDPLRDGPRDECGVFGIYAPEHDVARLAYFALYALQHRGQESAGIATCDRGGHIMTLRERGLVSQVFDEQKLRTLGGELAVGHVRYSTTGSDAWENTQPVYRSDHHQLALAHNGNLINAVELHAELRDEGVALQLDVGLGDHRRAALAPPGRRGSRTRSSDVMPRLQGAFSTVVLTKDRVVAFRDPAGLRPLALGRIGDRYCVASRVVRVRHHRRRVPARRAARARS